MGFANTPISFLPYHMRTTKKMSPNDRAHITATAQNVQVIAPIYFYAFIALFRPFGLNTGFWAPMCSLRCAHTAPATLLPPPRGQYATRIRLCARAIALRAYAVALAYG